MEEKRRVEFGRFNEKEWNELNKVVRMLYDKAKAGDKVSAFLNESIKRGVGIKTYDPTTNEMVFLSNETF